jgi:hypothetical protein
MPQVFGTVYRLRMRPGFPITFPRALRNMGVSCPIGRLIWNVFRIIAEIRVFDVKLFGIMVRGR